MSKTRKRALSALTLLCVLPTLGNAQSDRKPLTSGEVIAMIAGESVSQDIAQEINVRGLAFRPDDEYRSIAKAAGGDDRVLGALKGARIIEGGGQGQGSPWNSSLNHLALAGQAIRRKDYATASQELTSAVESASRDDAGFVMGDSLIQQSEGDEASQVLAEVVRLSPEFTAAHAKLAFALYSVGRHEAALNEAKVALAQNPQYAEAHKNAALALAELRRFELSEQEYQQALHLKPDYAAVYQDLGILYDYWHRWNDAIVAFKKAIALNAPYAVNNHYDLAIDYDKTGDVDSAIREYREAKRLDPSRVDVRQNLAGVLGKRDHSAAIKEYQELIALDPNFAKAHAGVGYFLLLDGDYKGAEAECEKAIQIYPLEADAFTTLGEAIEKQGRYSEAVTAYLRAEALDPEHDAPHRLLGRTYLEQKMNAQAIEQLRTATHLKPTDAGNHDLLAQAFAADGDLDGAISEYREALKFAPQNYLVMSELAPLLEKRGDTKGALEQYRQAAEVGQDQAAHTAYADAQKRLGAKLVSARPEKENSKPVVRPRPSVPPAQLESVWRQTFSEGDALNKQGKQAEAQDRLEYAVSLAERLTPQDDRLFRTLSYLALVYFEQRKIDQGRAVTERGLALGEQIYGSQSKEIVPALESLGDVATHENDFPKAETLYMRAFELNEKFTGAESTFVGMDLSRLGLMYQKEKAFDKAEPLFLRALTISDALSQGGYDPVTEHYVTQVQNLYLAWPKFDKAEPHARRVLAIRERTYGPNSPMVLNQLRTVIDILTKIGKTEEADNLRKRAAAISDVEPPSQP